ncbi:MAG TPA: hypothetical protein VN541_15455 [Tepidisphaeraceae bacterium]|nr:hypothetical protein [Tepidisphaeraceae bacterium]
MASSKSHIDQWKHNREFLVTIPAAYPDWIVTVAFYVSLHAVDALLSHDKVAGVTRHDARNAVVIRTNRYLAIKKAYLPLYDLSRRVRYLADPSAWVPTHELQKNVVERYLYPIEKSVQRLIGVNLALPQISIGGV